MQAALSSAPLRVHTSLSAAEWDGFVERQPAGTVEHLWAWQDIFARVFRHAPVYLAARRGDEIAGVLPLVKINSLIFGRSVVSLPFANYAGLVTSDYEAAHALAKEAEAVGQAFGASYVELRNVERRLPTLPCRTHKVGSRLQLPRTSEELWNRIDRKVRNQVRKARKEGLTCESGGDSLVPAFYSVFAHNMRDLGTPVFPKRLFEEVLRQLPIEARVFVVRHKAAPVAAAIALGWRGVTLVPWASSLKQYRNLCPNVLLYWEMLEAAISASYQVFDFGRSTPGGGTHHFKQQWDATDIPLHWEYPLLSNGVVPDHGPSNARLKVFISAWQRLPIPLANALGPEITRQLPG